MSMLKLPLAATEDRIVRIQAEAISDIDSACRNRYSHISSCSSISTTQLLSSKYTFLASIEKYLKFFEKTCQECVSEDIYRVKGIRVWVPAQATRQGRADIGTALLFPAVLPAVFDTRGRQGGGVSPARPVSFPRLRRGLRFETQNQLFSCHPTGGLLLFRIANSLHIASKSGILHSQGGDKLWQELLMYSLV